MSDPPIDIKYIDAVLIQNCEAKMDNMNDRIMIWEFLCEREIRRFSLRFVDSSPICR